ncbi:tegument serine/threonine protein kinase UL13 [Leporid alphaherpesvirus 4]|uniref:Tegument serine/threonine protein kinase UL13 n=1 Tax=Leporid alphaherpesvirus 4 TaxID=481315 RepID=J9QWK5_9ALPH|nr:tegument serine/threonine protein kinase UL13 [Leporid alphaherpesvirus 4]AFR32454.1 tegument serine/threonine protein kinase UL13 [Leporid alphaherpesvirus 4]
MDESNGQRPSNHVADKRESRCPSKRSLRSRIASYLRRSLSWRHAGRQSFSSRRSDVRQHAAAHGIRSKIYERPRTGSPDRVSSGRGRGPRRAFAAELKRPALRRACPELVSAPPVPQTILSLHHIHKLCSPVFSINSEMLYTEIDLPGVRKFAGSGGYGEVELLSEHKLAVKTIKDGGWYAAELVATLLVGDYAIRGMRSHNVRSLIIPLAFSIQSKQIVFPAYDMDFGKYTSHLASSRPTDFFVVMSIYTCFSDMARAVLYLNMSCGVSHLDIKSANILVNLHSDAMAIRKAVLADFSLLTLNSSSVVRHAQFSLREHNRERTKNFPVPASLTMTNFYTLVGHGYNQPSELLIKYLNNERTEFAGLPLPYDFGRAVDLYALGQTLLELLLSVYVSSEAGIPIPRFPGYQYYSHQMSPDFAIAILAYRCVLHPVIFVTSPTMHALGAPHDVADSIRRHMRSTRLRRIFYEQCAHYRRTYKGLLATVTLPLETKPLVNLVSHLCHANPSARHVLFEA